MAATSEFRHLAVPWKQRKPFINCRSSQLYLRAQNSKILGYTPRLIPKSWPSSLCNPFKPGEVVHAQEPHPQLSTHTSPLFLCEIYWLAWALPLAFWIAVCFCCSVLCGTVKIREVNGKHGPPPWQSPSQKREADMEPWPAFSRHCFPYSSMPEVEPNFAFTPHSETELRL